jgi:biotin carboxylase
VQRLLLLTPATSYRTADFLSAASRLDVALTVACDHETMPGRGRTPSALHVPFTPIGDGVARILDFAITHPVHAVVATDEGCAALAAAASRALGLRHNAFGAVAIAGDKHRARCTLARAGLPVPRFRLLDLDADREAAARTVPYPCVLKPLHLCASQGVIRADDPAAFVAAAARIEAILEAERVPRSRRQRRCLLVEDFIPGREVSLDALLDGGRLTPLAVFDKPDAPVGPFFEETLLVTPSELSREEHDELVRQVHAAAAAMGLREGPVHAEARVNEDGVWLLELAARSIGGLCSRALRFAPDLSLEELILRHALGRPVHNFTRAGGASGVLMIPMPAAGTLRGVDGADAARAIGSIEDLRIGIAPGQALVPPPEGDRYLGFIFARAGTRAEVEHALHAAHAQLHFRL